MDVVSASFLLWKSHEGKHKDVEKFNKHKFIPNFLAISKQTCKVRVWCIQIKKFNAFLIKLSHIYHNCTTSKAFCMNKI